MHGDDVASAGVSVSTQIVSKATEILLDIDMAHSHNYNPFNYIYDVDGNYSATAVIKMVNVLMKNTSKEGGGGGDQFWDDSTKALLAALCFYLVECEDKSMQNFSEVMKLLKKAEVKEGTSMRANKLQAEKKAIQSGYTSDVINEDLKHSLIEAEELLDDLRSKNQKMFLNNVIIMVTAKDFDELENNTETIEAVVRKHICSVSTLKFQQEKGLQSVLPLGNCTLNIRRTLTTESTAVFLPFSAKEITQQNGMYYGLNALSNNMIIFNRLMLKNPNGFILGSPGSGKSFSAKREMLNVFLATDDDIIIIDPEREYTNLVEALNGEIINVSPASTNFINPLDMSKDYSDDESPLIMKSDFILSFCECLVGKQGLTAKEKTIIDRCLNITYGSFKRKLRIHKRKNSRI